MSWFDYTRGYDDGREEYRLSKDNNGLLLSLIQFAFSILILLLPLTWSVLKGLAGLLSGIVNMMPEENCSHSIQKNEPPSRAGSLCLLFQFYKTDVKIKKEGHGLFFCINHCTKFGYPPEYAGKEFGINTSARSQSPHLFRSSLRKSAGRLVRFHN